MPSSALRGTPSRAWPVALGACCAAVVAGCIKPQVDMLDARAAIDRIQANFARIDKPLTCSPALASFRFRDADGRDQRFLGHPATVVFQGPRCLYFSIRSPLAGPIAHIGSNDDLYWFWVDAAETRKLWWGTWTALEEGRARTLAVPPGQLLDALMLAPPQDSLPDGIRPFVLKVGDEQQLTFLRLDEDGWPTPARVMTLDPATGLPIRVVDYKPDGRVVMEAEIGGWRPIDGTGSAGPLTPRRYVVSWRLDQAELRLDVERVAYFEKDTPFCEFDPRDWRGEQERLDTRAAPPADPRSEGALGP